MPYIGNTAADRFVASKAASVYSGDGSTTAFTLEHSVGADEDILVSVDGVIQEPSVAYAVSSGTTLTFTAAPSSNSGNNIFVYYLFRTVATVDHPATSALTATSGTFSAGVSGTTGTFTGDLTVDTTTLVVDSTNNRVGVGTASPGAGLTLEGTKDNLASQLKVTASGVVSQYMGGGDAVGLAIGHDHASLPIVFKTGVNSGTGVAGSGTTRMKIDGTGIVTLPNQPSFLARPASQQNNITNDGQHNQVAFGTEVFDRNADFTSNTFTAPIEGLYQFNAHIYVQAVDSAAAALYIVIKTSNREFLNVIDPDFGQDAGFWTFTMSVLADMDANDTTDIKIVQSSGTAQTDVNVGSSFSGYLVC
mgnify:CR=1 FL=1